MIVCIARIATFLMLCLLAACASAPVPAPVSDPLQLFDQGNYGASLPGLKAMADKGSARAEADLGYLYAYGIGVPRDEATAIHLYQQAEDQGFVEAKNREALLYLTGETTVHDPVETEALFRAASDEGDGIATGNLVMMFGGGIGVPVDAAKAKSLNRGNSSAYDVAIAPYIKALRDCVDNHKIYPTESILAGQTGVVRVAFGVDRKIATNIHVTKTSNFTFLDRAAVVGVAACIFPDPPPGILPPASFEIGVSFSFGSSPPAAQAVPNP